MVKMRWYHYSILQSIWSHYGTYLTFRAHTLSFVHLMQEVSLKGHLHVILSKVKILLGRKNSQYPEV